MAAENFILLLDFQIPKTYNSYILKPNKSPQNKQEVQYEQN